MKRIAVISAILEEPKKCQQPFNEVVSACSAIVRGRMGIPFNETGIAVVCLTVVGTLDEINGLTGRLGNLEHVQVKTAVSKKEVPQ